MALLKQNNYEIIAPPPTFFRHNLSVDETAQKKHMGILCDNGALIVFHCGTAGENHVIPKDVRDDVIMYALKEANILEMDVIVGLTPASLNRKSLREITDEANSRFEPGAYAVVLTPPFSGPHLMSQEGLATDYFAPILEGIDGRVILYNLPGLFGNTIEVDLLESLVDNYRNVVGFKNSGSLDLTKEAIKRVGRLREDGRKIKVYHGNESELVDALNVGADGGVTTIADALPELVLIEAGYPNQELINEAIDIIYPGQKNIPKCLKTAINLRYGIGNTHSGRGLTHPGTEVDKISNARFTEMIRYLEKFNQDSR